VAESLASPRLNPLGQTIEYVKDSLVKGKPAGGVAAANEGQIKARIPSHFIDVIQP
jgi:hypothetical protein